MTSNSPATSSSQSTASTTIPKPASKPPKKNLKFPPTEEAALLSESNVQKTLANTSFHAADYTSAIELYDSALSTLPAYLHYERAVIKSNVAACHIHTRDWKEAVKTATEAIDLLDAEVNGEVENGEGAISNAEDESEDEDEFVDAHEDITTIPSPSPQEAKHSKGANQEEEEAETEIISAGALLSEPIHPDPIAHQRNKDIARIRAKALLRRAKARTEISTWSSLTGAEEDYKALASMDNLSVADRRLVQAQLRSLPSKTKKAQETEMAEMMGKLKGLGNSILKPFGMSTDNFNMVKDPVTGSYSMNFNQGGN